ncbi:MAG: PRC-barrel domain-containing protein [Candidatus Sericytochromatia bacterium]|nr:PRC-barrel domain-containing protein [Candidatus Sericytochromatia bacterium]
MEWNVIQATVHTRDGEAGRVWKLVLDPESQVITHLVVHEGVLFGRAVLVPTSRVCRVTDDHVWLSMDHDALAELPDYRPEHFQEVAPGPEMPIALPLGGLLWPRAFQAPPIARPTAPDAPRPDEVTLDAGTAVACKDGPCGHIERLLMDEQTHHLRGFVIRQGLLFQRRVSAPVSWIDHVDAHGVHLKLTRQQVTDLAQPFDGGDQAR